MLQVHPVARLIAALLIAAAIIGTTSILTVSAIYAAVLLLILTARVWSIHLRFVTFVTSPLLIALILVWGWAADAKQIPMPHMTGVQYAFFSWLRLVTAGGLLQWLFVPLVERPVYLKDFVTRTHLRGSLGTLIIVTIVFLPEVKRRIGRIVDARKAQGYVLHGVNGVIELPKLLMPLVSSLLESASGRAELWNHRGLLEFEAPLMTACYSRWQSAAILLLAGVVSMMILVPWT